MFQLEAEFEKAKKKIIVCIYILKFKLFAVFLPRHKYAPLIIDFLVFPLSTIRGAYHILGLSAFSYSLY